MGCGDEASHTASGAAQRKQRRLLALDAGDECRGERKPDDETRRHHEQGSQAQMVSGDAFNTEEFWTITGPAGEGMIFTFAPEPRNFPSAKEVVEKFRASGYDPEGYTLYTYAAVQAYKQAVEAVGSADDNKKLAEWLRAGNTLKTVLGDITLDEKGDIKDAKYVWYKFHDGKYAEDPSLQ